MTFLSLPVGLETLSSLELINHTILKLGMYFASQLDFLSKYLIMTVIIFLFTLLLLYLKLPAYTLALVYLGVSYLHLNLDILIWASEMLPGVVNKGYV